MKEEEITEIVVTKGIDDEPVVLDDVDDDTSIDELHGDLDTLSSAVTSLEGLYDHISNNPNYNGTLLNLSLHTSYDVLFPMASLESDSDDYTSNDTSGILARLVSAYNITKQTLSKLWVDLSKRIGDTLSKADRLLKEFDKLNDAAEGDGVFKKHEFVPKHNVFLTLNDKTFKPSEVLPELERVSQLAEQFIGQRTCFNLVLDYSKFIKDWVDPNRASMEDIYTEYFNGSDCKLVAAFPKLDTVEEGNVTQSKKNSTFLGNYRLSVIFSKVPSHETHIDFSQLKVNEKTLPKTVESMEYQDAKDIIPVCQDICRRVSQYRRDWTTRDTQNKELQATLTTLLAQLRTNVKNNPAMARQRREAIKYYTAVIKNVWSRSIETELTMCKYLVNLCTAMYHLIRQSLKA